MLHLTKQEKIVLVSLGGVILLGSVLHYFYHTNRAVHDFLSFVDSERVYYKIDPNRASLEELLRVPYLGEKVARQIIAHREEKGPLTDLEDIRWLKGVGPRKFEKIRKYFPLAAEQAGLPTARLPDGQGQAGAP